MLLPRHWKFCLTALVNFSENFSSIVKFVPCECHNFYWLTNTRITDFKRQRKAFLSDFENEKSAFLNKMMTTKEITRVLIRWQVIFTYSNPWKMNIQCLFRWRSKRCHTQPVFPTRTGRFSPSHFRTRTEIRIA